ncbi:MAG TPA: HAD hydrolase-like protein, partial [Candidatus Nanoarchaeia archaeon]|nr:HAD hydrolase-like protein [Candidatus Nanoarchaeia archaeon]
MNNRAFIFDIDGTLVNLRTMWKQTYTFLYQREHNYTLSEAEIKSMFGSPELECPDVILRQLGLYTRERAAEMVRRTEDIMLLTLSRENVSKYIPHGVIPCLQELQRAHAAVGCATGNTEAVAKSILHHSGLEEYFPVLAYS